VQDNYYLEKTVVSSVYQSLNFNSELLKVVVHDQAIAVYNVEPDTAEYIYIYTGTLRRA